MKMVFIRHARLFIPALLTSLLCAGTFPAPGRSVLTSEMLLAGGLVRISDIFLLADRWPVNSIDGFTWRAAPNGLSSFQDQGWVVMVDGHRYDLKTLGVINLNALPVSLDLIDSVEIFSSPQLHHGEFTDKGLIHIHTARPQKGIRARAHYYAGNETGDPGPYVYTKYRTPNVDRLSFDESASFDVAYSSWYARLFLIWRTHTFTDVAFCQRVRSAVTEYTFASLLSSQCRIGREGERGTQEMLLGYTYGVRQQQFFKPIGREIPSNYIVPYIGLRGSLSLSKNTDILYRLHYARNTLDEIPNLFEYEYDWSLHSLAAAAELNIKRSQLPVHAGISVEKFALDTHAPLANSSYSIGRIFAGMRYRWSSWSQSSLEGMIASSNGRVAAKLVLANRWNLGPVQTIGASVAYSGRLLEEENSWWYWVGQGYDILEKLGTLFHTSGDLDQSVGFVGDVDWTLRARDGLLLEASLLYRQMADLTLERLSYSSVPTEGVFTSPVTLLGDCYGEIVGFSLAVLHSPNPRLTQRLFYMYQTAIRGDRVFRDVQANVPQHKASILVTYAPVENLAVWARIHYLSTSYWSEYENIAGATCNLGGGVCTVYSPAVSEAIIFDLAAKKWFWRRRVISSVLLRNIWNQKFGYHPVGANFDLSLLIRIQMLIDFSQ
jgi:hypothetical protein